MTARVKGFTVTLEEDIREDDFQRVIEAVELIKGVIHVEPVLVTGENFVDRQRIRLELVSKMVNILNKDE